MPELLLPLCLFQSSRHNPEDVAISKVLHHCQELAKANRPELQNAILGPQNIAFQEQPSA